jgi:hypothetical protein
VHRAYLELSVDLECAAETGVRNVACQVLRAKGAVFVVWGKPEVDDVGIVALAVESAVREYGAPIVYITRVPAGAPAPSGVVKDRVNEVLPRILSCCSSYHVVLEGEGFVAAFKRGALTNLLQPFWRKRMFFVHAACAGISATLLPHEIAPAEAVLGLAEKRGLTQGDIRISA